MTAIVLGLLAILVWFVFVIALAAGILMVYERIFRPSLSPEEIAKIVENHRRRLLNPDLEFAEKHYGCAMPEAIKLLYSDKSKILRAWAPPGEPDWVYAEYEPLDREAIEHPMWDDPVVLLVFASSEGDCYFIDPQFEDPEVFCYYHDGGKAMLVDASLSHFLCNITEIDV